MPVLLGNLVFFGIPEVHRRILVAVGHIPTFTDIDSVGQLQVTLDVSAVVARFRARVKAVSNAELDAAFMAFRHELRAKFVEFACCNSFRQMLVLHHAAHVQVFDGDEAWFSLQDGIDDLVRVVRADAEPSTHSSRYLQRM